MIKQKNGGCFVCKKKGGLIPTLVRNRVILLCKEHSKEYYGC